MELLEMSIIRLSFGNASVIHRVRARRHVEERFRNSCGHETFGNVVV